MNYQEYQRVKNYNYLEYCNYLQNKYGKAKYNYFTTNYTRNTKVTRTKEGLFVHHKFEDHAILLANADHARMNPFEWQYAENLIYCDYLEHLLLHILICEYPAPDANPFEAVGIGGAVNFIIPELNDLYSGYPLKMAWKINCFNAVKDDQEVYLALVKRFKHNCKDYPLYNESKLYSSFNEKFGTWSIQQNKKIIKLLKEL